jgi:hypothetical protein
MFIVSRTYRRNKPNGRNWDSLDYRLEESFYKLEEAQKIADADKVELYTSVRWGFVRYTVRYSKTSKKGKEIIARWRSDAGVIRYKEPGPMWYVREFTQVPFRMKCKTELAKWKKDNEYEVIIEDMPHLDYWT